MTSRADEVEALLTAVERWGVTEETATLVLRIHDALREYAALLREDRCAPLLEALERIASGRHIAEAWEAAQVAALALRAHREREGGERG